ncbi:MAG: VOC family protein [Pseudomonadota bacterium]
MTELVGKAGWIDMTVVNAEQMRDFYADVVGFDVDATDMGGYEDFTMKIPATGDAVVGICHARGDNADMPQGWVVYFVVDDLDESLARCEALGGQKQTDIREYGGGRYCLVRDPSGTPSALFQQ